MRYTSQAVGVLVIVVGLAALLASVGWHASLGETMGWLVPLVVLCVGVWVLVEAVVRSRRGATRDPGPAWAGASMPPPATPIPAAPAPSFVAAAGPDAMPLPRAVADAAPPAPTPVAPSAFVPFTPASPASAPPAPAPLVPGPAVAAPTGVPSPVPLEPSGWGPAPGGDPAPVAPPVPGPTQPVYPLEFRRTLGEIELAGPMSFGNARVETVLGEIRLDLTQATFPEGETTVHVSTGLGEVRVLVPAGMPVMARASTLLGETEALGRIGGSFMGSVEEVVDEPAGATRRLRVIAQAGIGAVAIRRERVPAFPGAPFTFAPQPPGAWSDAQGWPASGSQPAPAEAPPAASEPGADGHGGPAAHDGSAEGT